MALKFAEHRRETTTNKPANSSTAFNLGGQRTGFTKFIGGDIASGDVVVYTAQKVDANGNPSGAAETCVGTVTSGSPATLSRSYFISGHDGSGNAISDFIDWSATGEDSSPDVMIVSPAALVPANGLSPAAADGTVWHLPYSVGGGGGWTYTDVTAFLVMDVPQPALIKALRVNNTTAVNGAQCRLLAYTDKAGQPYKKLVEGTMTLDGTTGFETYTPSSPVFFPGGRLWLGFQGNNSSTQFACMSGTISAFTLHGTLFGLHSTTPSNACNGFVCYTQGFAAGALDPWNEAVVPVQNDKSIQIVQVQLEYL
jgi:hypothetical protein